MRAREHSHTNDLAHPKGPEEGWCARGVQTKDAVLHYILRTLHTLHIYMGINSRYIGDTVPRGLVQTAVQNVQVCKLLPAGVRYV